MSVPCEPAPAHAPVGAAPAAAPPGTRADLLAALDRGIPALGAGEALLLLVLDVDGFRRFNAEHGYAAGDAFLADLGSRLAALDAAAFALGSDAFALVLRGTPEALWRRGAGALWSLDPRAGGPELHCSFGAVVVVDPATRAVAALALAEDRLADQRTRAPSVGDRYGELILTILRAQQPETSEHALDVAQLAVGVAARLNVAPIDRALVRRAAELHDVGKIAIDPAIVGKPGPLDDAEWTQMRRHTIIGEELLAAAPPLRAVAPLVRASHERWDGSGYPDGAGGTAIPIAARIVAACDAYDAMTTDRVYRRAMSPADARAELKRCAGTQFDRDVVAALRAELLEPHRHHPLVDAAAAAGAHRTRESGSLATFARLHSQLDAASQIESADELPFALETIAAAIARSLGFKAVVVNLYRKAWDDFFVSTVHGEENLRSELLGATYSWADWEGTLDERFRHGATYLVYDGELDWEQQSGKRIVNEDVVITDGPDAWMAEDEIFVPFHHSDGSMLGILNVGSPQSGRRPSEEDLEVLTIVVRHAARAVQRAQDAANAADHKRGLEQLLRVSSKLTETVSPEAVLQAICSGISQGLGFARVLVQLRAADSDLLVSSAGVGIETNDVSTRFVLHDDDLERLLDPMFEQQGCYLLPLEEAKRRVPSYHDTFPSVTNGRGRAAWDRHWLVVPLVDRSGARLGAVFADDPADRLLPTRERLQALRLFANQATSALESSAQYETMRHLADRDPLTKLLNRRAFVRRLDEAGARARETGEPLALVYCDLDDFKGVNDTRGHAAGDRLLRAFGEVLVAAVRHGDAVFRMGGDEFALLLEHCARGRALDVVDRLVARLEAEAGTGDLPAGASFGVAILDPADPVDSDELLKRADDAMYAAKASTAALRVVA
jgi:diguanylate cyclase (GGDEF)-like protein